MNTKRAHGIGRGAVSLGEFLERAFPVDKQLLGLMVLVKSIGMLAGPRGGGKSWLAIIMCYAIAGGKELLPWGIGAGVRVAYLDGEMRGAGLQARLRMLHAHNSKQSSIAAAEKNLVIISRDALSDATLAIDTVEGQAAIDELIPDDVSFIVIDNLSAWRSTGREDIEAWGTIKKWLIAKRLGNFAVLLVHHTGKSGQQRGSSAHEDLLDYSILLSPLPSKTARKETRFLVDHTKLRDNIPSLKQRYEFSIWSEEDKLNFEAVPAGFDQSENAAEMLRLREEENMTLDAIGKVFGVSKSTVSRTLDKIRRQQQSINDDD